MWMPSFTCKLWDNIFIWMDTFEERRRGTSKAELALKGFSRSETCDILFTLFSRFVCQWLTYDSIGLYSLLLSYYRTFVIFGICIRHGILFSYIQVNSGYVFMDCFYLRIYFGKIQLMNESLVWFCENILETFNRSEFWHCVKPNLYDQGKKYVFLAKIEKRVIRGWGYKLPFIKDTSVIKPKVERI